MASSPDKSAPVHGLSARRSGALKFGEFELSLRTGELYRNGRSVKLQQQPCKVLGILAARSGELITRDELREEIWPNGTFVDFEHGINFCIKQIRVALGDDAHSPVYIETLPRRGYRFIAPVEISSGGSPVSPLSDGVGGEIDLKIEFPGITSKSTSEAKADDEST